MTVKSRAAQVISVGGSSSTTTVIVAVGVVAALWIITRGSGEKSKESLIEKITEKISKEIGTTVGGTVSSVAKMPADIVVTAAGTMYKEGSENVEVGISKKTLEITGKPGTILNEGKTYSEWLDDRSFAFKAPVAMGNLLVGEPIGAYMTENISDLNKKAATLANVETPAQRAKRFKELNAPMQKLVGLGQAISGLFDKGGAIGWGYGLIGTKKE